MSGIEEPAPFYDPLQACTEFAYRATFFPLGFPAEIKSNDIRIPQAAALTWGSFACRFDYPPIELRVIVTKGQAKAKLQVPIFRAQRNLMTVVSDAAHFGACDLVNGFGFAYALDSTLKEADFFRYHFIEGMVYTLLNTRYLATIHAACVSWNQCGVLLIGASGSGKSSFSYACSRRGWTYTSDDATSILLDANDRKAIGNPTTFRFRPSISALFPELSGYVKERNGKPTLEIRTESLPGVTLTDECDIKYVIFLNRSGVDLGGDCLTPVPRHESLLRLSQNPWPSELPVRAAQANAIERLSEAPAFDLTYRGLDPAIDLLQDLIARA